MGEVQYRVVTLAWSVIVKVDHLYGAISLLK